MLGRCRARRICCSTADLRLLSADSFSNESWHLSGSNRKLQRLPLNINDEAFADALVAAWHEITTPSTAARLAR